ncbi:DNA primase [Mycoplasmopsis columbina]|uniref:DNA primase n=1 Tax=Mycoplasmopsis columbina TaxID=114881 RepID=UPI0004A6B882|nr:DNA primase [Mycoplasmopsis columbina]VEU76864.1 DNA primase [Mycoplasmopsis columbina]
MANSENINVFETVIAANDIVDVISQFLTLSKKGRSYVSLCPFHSDTNPSMTISPDKQIFKCFVCSVGGNALTFVSKYKKISNIEALEYLAQRANIDLKDLNFHFEKKEIYSEKDKNLIEFLERVNSFYKVEFKKTQNFQVKEFFAKRDLSIEILDNFDIGYSNEEMFRIMFENDFINNKELLLKTALINAHDEKYAFKDRITFGIRDEYGSLVGFSARTLEKDLKPKYVNSAESNIFKKSHILYNYFQANQDNSNTLIICEGFFDVIALYKAGIKNAVALMGTALTKNHQRLLKDKKVILFLDGDDAGKRATLKSAKFLLDSKIETFVVQNPTVLDPDEILKSNSANFLKNLIDQAIAAYDYIYEELVKEYHLVKKSSDNALNNLTNFTDVFGTYFTNADERTINLYAKKIENDFFFEFKVKSKAKDLQHSNEFSLNEFDQNEFGFWNQENELENNNSNFLDPNFYLNYETHIDLKHKVKKNDWINKLFFLLLEFPDLRDLFIDTYDFDTDAFCFEGFEDKNLKEELLELLTIKRKFLTTKKVKELKTTYFQEEAYAEILDELRNISPEQHKLVFNDAYSRAVRESDEAFLNNYKNMVKEKIFDNFTIQAQRELNKKLRKIHGRRNENGQKY